MKKTLSIRAEAEGQSPSDPRQSWGISPARQERLKDHARQMRRNPTEPEIALWDRLQGQKLGGFKFQRKQVVGSAIVDFACPARWLVVDVDGDAHDTPAIDALRDKKLTDVGIRVLRFAAGQVMQDGDGVCETILAELEKEFEKPGQAVTSRTSPEPQASETHQEGLEQADSDLPLSAREQLELGLPDPEQAAEPEISPELPSNQKIDHQC
ncbi:MAG: DUF559 domain-containing protein [Novosphingobium sp.]|nr:DUF559 domain-containing protein [Novosphingobium sp.]